jgi:hypothetical protein
MNIVNSLLISIVFATSMAAAAAPPSSSPPPTQAPAPTPQESLALLDTQWNQFRLSGDVDALGKLLADDWLLTHSDGRVQTKQDYLTELSLGARRNQAIANEDLAFRFYAGLGVVTGVSVQSGVSNGLAWQGRFRFTRVWVRRGDAWQMVASHSSRITAPR